MTADQFAQWMAHRCYNKQQAAEALGISRNSVATYLKDGTNKTVALACSADAMGLKPWPMGG